MEHPNSTDVGTAIERGQRCSTQARSRGNTRSSEQQASERRASTSPTQPGWKPGRGCQCQAPGSSTGHDSRWVHARGPEREALLAMLVVLNAGSTTFPSNLSRSGEDSTEQHEPHSSSGPPRRCQDSTVASSRQLQQDGSTQWTARAAAAHGAATSHGDGGGWVRGHGGQMYSLSASGVKISI